MSDHIERIREALEAGPTQGKWEASCDEDGEWGICANGEFLTYAFPNRDGETEAVARYIAACHPLAIRALLDRLDAAERERDSKAAELANLQVAFSDWKVFHSTARLEAENERLRDLLARTLGGHRDLDLQDAIIAAIDAARREK